MPTIDRMSWHLSTGNHYLQSNLLCFVTKTVPSLHFHNATKMLIGEVTPFLLRKSVNENDRREVDGHDALEGATLERGQRGANTILPSFGGSGGGQKCL